MIRRKHAAHDLTEGSGEGDFIGKILNTCISWIFDYRLKTINLYYISCIAPGAVMMISSPSAPLR